MKKAADPDLMSSKEYAEFLGVHVERLYLMNAAGELPIKPVRIGKRLLRWSKSAHAAAIAEASRRSVSQVGANIQHKEDSNG